MLLTAAFLALTLDVQDTTAFDGAAFAFRVPAGATVNENGNGAYFFTDVRRDARVEDQSDATLKLLVVPDGGGFDVGSLTQGLIGDTGGRMTAAGLTAGANEVVERTFDGHTVAMTRIAYSDANAALWVFEFGAWQQGGAMIGVVTKCAAATLVDDRAEIEALVASIDAKEIDTNSTRMVTAGFATVPIPLAAQVQVQAIDGESMHSIGTQAGAIHLHWGGATRAQFGIHDLASTWRNQHATEVRQMAQQAGAEYLGVEGFLEPWGQGIAPGEAHRVRLADGGTLEFRSTTFIQDGEVLILTAEVAGAQAAAPAAAPAATPADVQRARIAAIEAALPDPTDTIGEHFVVAAGVRVDLPNALMGDWKREGERTFVDYALSTDATSIFGGFAVEVCDARAQLAQPSSHAQARAVQRSAAATNFALEEGVIETQLLGAVSTATLRYVDGEQSMVAMSAAVPAGERSVLVTLITRAEDERGHAELWRRTVENAYVDAFDAAAADGRSRVQGRCASLFLPNPQWVAQCIEQPSFATLKASEPRAALELLRTGEATRSSHDDLVPAVRTALQNELGTSLEQAPGRFGGTRRFGESHALMLGAHRVVDGGARELVRFYALRDFAGDVDFIVNAPLDPAERAATGIESLLDSLSTIATLAESPIELASFGTRLVVPEGFTIDETYSNGFAFVSITGAAADTATFSARQFLDALPDAQAIEFAYQRENLTALIEQAGLTFETVDFELDVGGTRVPAVRFLIAATETAPANHILASARSFGPMTMGFTIGGSPEQLAETERCYLDLVAQLTAAPLLERFGGPDASFSHAVSTTVATRSRNVTGAAVEFLVTSAQGNEMVLTHANGAWSTLPAASDLADDDLTRITATLATTSVESSVPWANDLFTARFPAHGSVTAVANGAQWTAPSSADTADAPRTALTVTSAASSAATSSATPTVVRIRAWPDKAGGLDLFETLRDFTNFADTDGAEFTIVRELRPLVGRTSFGRVVHIRFADGRTQERHVHVVRCFDTDVSIDFTIDARDPAARADAELIASTLRLTSQPTAPGRLVQGDFASLVVPWYATALVDVFDATAEQIDIGLDADTTFSLSIGPDTDEQRAYFTEDLAFLLGSDPTGGTSITLPILGLERSGEHFTTLLGVADLALSRYRFSAASHAIQFLAFYASTAAHTTNHPIERAIAASIQLR